MVMQQQEPSPATEAVCASQKSADGRSAFAGSALKAMAKSPGAVCVMLARLALHIIGAGTAG